MANFLFIYHGGRDPEGPEEVEVMLGQWGGWLGGLGDATVDEGNPVGQSYTVNPDNSVADNGGANPASGYGIFRADSLEQALEIAKGCPILLYDGSIEVAEIHEVTLD